MISKYVVATVEHFQSVHEADVSGERKSLDGLQAVVEVPESDVRFDACPECRVFSHASVLEFLNGLESVDVWYEVTPIIEAVAPAEDVFPQETGE